MIRKFSSLVLILSLFIIPTFIFATNTSSAQVTTYSTNSGYSGYSEQDLMALIAKLQKQLEELRSNTIQCALAEVDLSLGDGEGGVSMEQVKNLQNFLKEKGYFSLGATGYFGKITRASLISFQKASGLTQTGELDQATRTYIKTLSCKKMYQEYKKEMKYEVKEAEKKMNVITPTTSVSPVTSITLSGTGSTVTWMASGYSKSGFKIVWSKNPAPTYPNRDGDKYIYLTDPNAKTANLEAFSGAGTYYVRVCEYTGVCGVYSNEISVSL